MPFIGPWEIALILAIVLIIFGPKKLPELAKSMGDAIKQYRDASSGNLPSTSNTQTASKPNADGILIENAKKLGIKTEGKTLEQISEEIVKVTQKATTKKTTKKK
ncbi:Sec-independent protein translocase subunit TatA/TatB [[Eubacterium] cellulosolvens]